MGISTTKNFDVFENSTAHYGPKELVRDADLLALDQASRHFFDIELNSIKGQDFDTLKSAFNIAGFDIYRPKVSFGDMSAGNSYQHNDVKGTANIYAYPCEIQSLRNQGYAVSLEESQPAHPRIGNVSNYNRYIWARNKSTSTDWSA